MKEILSRTVYQSKVIPKKLIAIYKVGEQQNSYVESALVDMKGRPGSFAPMTVRSIYNLAEELRNIKRTKATDTFKGWIEDRLAYLEMSTLLDIDIIWKRPAKPTFVKYAKKLKIPDGEIDTPNMVFRWQQQEQDLYVYAYKQWEGRMTELFHLPFHNVYESGKVCMGSSRTKFVKTDSIGSYISRLEYLFFNTGGSEIHYSEAFNTNINTLHRKLSKDKMPFPVEELISKRSKLHQLVKK